MTGTRRTILFLAAAAPVTAFLLGGCYYSEKTVSERVPSSPVVVSAPSPPVVVTAPSSPVTVAAPSQRVISYPEGRFQLYGDATNGYYWVWIPAGSAAPVPPAPPALPIVSQGPAATVAATQSQTVINYPNGRYQLYGDATTGYYWVWIPAGVVVPYMPPAPPRVSQAP